MSFVDILILLAIVAVGGFFVYRQYLKKQGKPMPNLASLLPSILRRESASPPAVAPQPPITDPSVASVFGLTNGPAPSNPYLPYASMQPAEIYRRFPNGVPVWWDWKEFDKVALYPTHAASGNPLDTRGQEIKPMEDIAHAKGWYSNHKLPLDVTFTHEGRPVELHILPGVTSAAYGGCVVTIFYKGSPVQSTGTGTFGGHLSYPFVVGQEYRLTTTGSEGETVGLRR